MAMATEEKKEAKDEAEILRNKGKLFVGGLSPATTTKSLEAYFSHFGEVIDCVVIKHPRSHKTRGFGFVTFGDSASAKAALKREQHVLDGKRVDLRPFTNAPFDRKKAETFKVFLGGLADNVSSETLVKFFERYGPVSDVLIPRFRNTNKSKGFGFVYFKDEEAAEKCTSEGFAYLGGRRIIMKKAVPRDCSPSFETADHPEVDDSACSSTSEFKIKENFDRKLLEDCFLKESKSFYAINEVEDRKVGGNFAEIEDLLSQLLVSDNPDNNAATDQNLIQFSSGSESEEGNCFSGDILSDQFRVGRPGDEDDESEDDEDDESQDDEDDESQDDEDDGCSTDENNYSTSLDLFRSQLEILLTSSEKNFAQKGSALEEDKSSQMPVPLQFKNSDTTLYCSLCKWGSSDCSSGSFLAHCKTPAHREKLKERFSKELPQIDEKVEESRQPMEISNKLLKKPKSNNSSFHQKSSATTHKEASKVSREQVKKVQLTRKKNVEGNKIKNEHVKVQNFSNDKTTQKKKIKVGNFKNLKARSLAEGMSSIRLQSDDTLMCTMCNKTIPKALEFGTLMFNVSQHLQSKAHLCKKIKAENSLKEKLEPNPATQNHPTTKTREQKSGLTTNNLRKQLTKHSASSPIFICLPCNYLNGNINKFKSHLKSTAHRSCCASKGVQEELSLANLSKCESCQNFLFGSTQYVDKHYNKCSKK